VKGFIIYFTLFLNRDENWPKLHTFPRGSKKSFYILCGYTTIYQTSVYFFSGTLLSCPEIIGMHTKRKACLNKQVLFAMYGDWVRWIVSGKLTITVTPLWGKLWPAASIYVIVLAECKKAERSLDLSAKNLLLLCHALDKNQTQKSPLNTCINLEQRSL